MIRAAIRSADRAPAWSPSGTTLAFHSKRNVNWNIHGVAVSGGAAAGEPEAYTAATSAESSATWRSGGDLLAFASTQLGGSDIFTVEPPDPTSMTGASLGSVSGRPSRAARSGWISAGEPQTAAEVGSGSSSRQPPVVRALVPAPMGA